jgi:hypothetical protein
MTAKIKAVFNALKISLLAFLVLSCATSSNAFRNIDAAVERAEFSSAIDSIRAGQSRRRALYNERNAISMFLDKGLLEHYAGNFAASAADLQNAERLIEEAYTRSITEGFFSYILNDNTKVYPGEDFENIYLNIFNALNYYHKGNMEGALVEIRKLSHSGGKLDMLARRHEFVDPDTGENINSRVQRETGIGELPQTKSVNFSNSALARFLGALFYQADGNIDSARIEFDQVNRAFRANENIYRHPVPAAVEEARNIPAGKARLNIISFTGLSPIKVEQVIAHRLPFRHPVLQIAGFKLPVLVNRQSFITAIEVVVEGAESFNLELIEDMGAVIHETFNARFSSILTKTYIRTIMKYTIADITAMEIARQQGELRGLLVALAARTALDASESADIRMSRFLPNKAFVGGINLDPGVYNVYINYYNDNNIIWRDVHENFTVKRNELNLLQSVNLR